jgi:hypothetical protein
VASCALVVAAKSARIKIIANFIAGWCVEKYWSRKIEAQDELWKMILRKYDIYQKWANKNVDKIV